MKLKTLVLVPLLAGAVIYAGLKAYVYFKTKENLEQLTMLAAPFATLSYGAIGSDLGGKLMVENVQIKPVGTALSFNIGEVSVEGPDLGFLLALSDGFKGEEPPRYAYLKFKRAEVPSGGDILSQLDQLSQGLTKGAEKLMPEACTLGGIFQHVGMDKIGFGNLLADFSMGYKRYKQSEEVELSTDYRVDGLEAMELEMMLKGVPQLGAAMVGRMPNIGKIEASYRIEPAYMKGMVDYCAKQAEMTPQAYIDSLFNQPEGYYARNLGFIPGDGIRTAMKSLITKSGELRFSAYPTTELSARMLSAYKPRDLISLLGVQMSVNGRNVADMSFIVPEDLSLYSDDVETDDAAGPQREEKRKKLKPKRFIKTEISQLKQYIGKPVRIYLKEDGRMNKGVLDALDNGVASVDQSVYGGKFTSHIALDKIKSIEVWRRE